jgi:hypothetical protein
MKKLAYGITVLNDQLKVATHVLDMFSWIYKTIIVIQSHLGGDVLFRDEGVQDSSG